VSRASEYRATLRALTGPWEPFLQQESHLPGPRANLELLQAAADEGTVSQFADWLTRDDEFLAACGAAGFGRLAAEGLPGSLERLRQTANDRRWRVREAVATGLQRLGARDLATLLDALADWASGTPLERRAVVAALCEPALLRTSPRAPAVLDELDRITASLAAETDRRGDEVRALRQALGYGWSVAVAACPEPGKRALERWLASSDPDIRWLARENLKKDRLRRLDPAWVARWLAATAPRSAESRPAGRPRRSTGPQRNRR
jgi:hypothetical protein